MCILVRCESAQSISYILTDSRRLYLLLHMYVGTYRVLTINDNLIHVKTAVWKGREQWKEIGILLPGVEQDTINSVQGTNNGERLNEVLSKWIHTGKARINHLLTALRHTTVGRGDIADNICGLKGEERARVGLDL